MLSRLLDLQSLQKMCHAELRVGRSLIYEKKFLLERRSWLSLTLLEKKEMGREMGGGAKMSDWVFVEGGEEGSDNSGTYHQDS